MEHNDLTKVQLKRLGLANEAGHYTFRTDAGFAKLERLGLVAWRASRGSSDDVGRFYQTAAGRAALHTQPRG